MRLAVFTNEFPGRVCTFFARDMRGLLEAGIEIDVFPIYPLESTLWRYVPHLLDESVLPKSKIHHLSLVQTLKYVKVWPLGKFNTFLQDAAATVTSSVHLGGRSMAKSVYVLLKGWAWAQCHVNQYDHILAYWGNYAATYAYVYHRLTAPQIPFSIFFHASIDLYRIPVCMRKKLLYADNIITCSDFNRKFIQNNYSDTYHLISDKIYIHHHGLDFRELSYVADDRPLRKIIAVGRFTEQKGFDYLLRATYELKCRGTNIDVELIGDGQQEDALKALARELGIMERIKFRGWLTVDQVYVAMRQATILVHSSPALGDGVPNVIKEAMALGTPVIASDVAGISELLANGRHGVLVPPKDVKALANAIETLLANGTLQRQYAKAGREFAEKKFDLWRNGQRLAEFLRLTTRRRAV